MFVAQVSFQIVELVENILNFLNARQRMKAFAETGKKRLQERAALVG
jgi:hypothetical protein